MTTTYKLKPVHVRRLRKLIAFLRQLPRKRFNFKIVRNEPPKCGAVGCAIGYMPNVFPGTFRSVANQSSDLIGIKQGWDWTHNIEFRDSAGTDFSDVAIWLTGLEYWDAGDLFSPNKQHLIHKGLDNLPDSATPKQVARMLEKFIQLHT